MSTFIPDHSFALQLALRAAISMQCDTVEGCQKDGDTKKALALTTRLP